MATMGRAGLCFLFIAFLLIQLNAKLAIADCTMKNKSDYDIEISPADGSGDPLECKSGDTTKIPTNYERCKLKNKKTDHEMGPFTLPDRKFIVAVNGNKPDTANVYVAAFFRRMLKFVRTICMGL